MAWTGATREEYGRKGLRYPPDMADREWDLPAPFIPPAKIGSCRRTTDMREVVDALLYLASAGCAWRLMPKCFAPVSTVRRYFYAWRNAGLFETINALLVMNLREIEGCEASPSAGCSTVRASKPPSPGGGYDAGKKIKGRKRHILTDTSGFLISVLVHTADIQDRDGAVDVLMAVGDRFPWLRHVFADGGYAGDKLKVVLEPLGDWTIQIIKRLDATKGFGHPAPQVGGRADLCVAWPVPPPRQGLGDHHRFFNRMGHHRFHPHGQPQNRNLLLRIRNFRIRL